MTTVKVELKTNPYPVYIGNNILEEFPKTLNQHSGAKQAAIITSENIFELYGKKLLHHIDKSCLVNVLLVPQ